MRECRNREINSAAFTKLRLHLSRECIRYSPTSYASDFGPEFFCVALCDAFFKSARTRRRFVISVFLPSSLSATKLFPHAQFANDNAPCHETHLQGFARACLFSLIVPPFLILNSRLPHYLVPPPPFVPFPSFPTAFLHFERYACLVFSIFFFSVL